MLITHSNTRATQHDSICFMCRTSPASDADVVRKVCRERKSEAYPCREKLGEISKRFFDFWVPNALLAAHLSGNPANLWVNGAFLGDDRPYDGVGMV